MRTVDVSQHKGGLGEGEGGLQGSEGGRWGHYHRCDSRQPPDGVRAVGCEHVLRLAQGGPADPRQFDSCCPGLSIISEE